MYMTKKSEETNSDITTNLRQTKRCRDSRWVLYIDKKEETAEKVSIKK